MVDGCTPTSSQPPTSQDGVNDDPVKSHTYNRRIAHETTAIIENNRFTSYCTLEIRPEQKYYVIKTTIIHDLIFDQ